VPPEIRIKYLATPETDRTPFMKLQDRAAYGGRRPMALCDDGDPSGIKRQRWTSAEDILAFCVPDRRSTVYTSHRPDGWVAQPLAVGRDLHAASQASPASRADATLPWSCIGPAGPIVG